MGKNKYKVLYANAAENDLKDIFLYFFKNLRLPKRGRKIRKLILTDINNRLSYMPQNHMQVDDDNLAALGYRWFTAKYGYRIFFIVNEKKSTALVRQIIHGNREWLPILQKDAESLSAAIK